MREVGFRAIRVGLTAALLGVALIAPAATPVARAARPPSGPWQTPATQGRPSFDVRTDERSRPVRLTGSEIAARVRLGHRLGAQGMVSMDAASGTPRMVARLDGFLTGPSDDDAVDVALRYVRQLATLGPAVDVDALRLIRRYRDPSGTTHLVWEQRYDGIVVFDRDLHANVTADGRLVNVSGGALSGAGRRSLTPSITATSAVGVALRDAGVRGPAPSAISTRSSADRRTRFAGGHEAHLVLFPVRPGEVRLGWAVEAHASSAAVYQDVVDADSGALLYRVNTVAFEAAQPRVSYGTVNAWEYVPGSFGTVDPAGHVSGNAPANYPVPITNTTRLAGPYAHVYSDVDDNDVPDTPSQCQYCGEVPQSGWTTTFQPFVGIEYWFCDSAARVCSWDLTSPGSWTVNLRHTAGQVYYFLNHFHDWLKIKVGFDAASGAFEGSDAINAEVVDGALVLDPDDPIIPDVEHRRNANMATPPQGQPGHMQMYLFPGWGELKPDTMGSDDASVVYHEYTHGLAHRLVTGPQNRPALNSEQSGAMGEGWSDFYAMDYLEDQGFEEHDTTAYDGQMNPGMYVSGACSGEPGCDPTPMRPEGLDCPVGSASQYCSGWSAGGGPGGYTYGDYGRIASDGGGGFAPEVHADGMIWSQALWDLRVALKAANRINARQLVADGMRFAPPDPSMLDMRNAIIQADVANYGGADVATIWSVFARRGMGFFAATLNGDDTQPTEDFTTPPAGGGSATLSGTVRDKDSNAPVAGALVEIAGHTSGFAGDYVAKTDAAGRYTIGHVVPGAYPTVYATAPGFDYQIKNRVTVAPAGSTVDWGLRRDYAATAGGARVEAFSPPDLSEFGCGPGAALDGEVVTGWGSASPNNPEHGGEKSITVKLPEAIDVTAFGIAPGAVCGDGPSASTGRYRMETSNDGASWTVASTGAFSESQLFKLNEISPTGGARNVRFLRYTMLAPFQQVGEPDSPDGLSGQKWMDTAEVAVYGKPAAAPGPPGPPGPPSPPIAQLSKLKLAPSSFRPTARTKGGASVAARRGGAAITYVDSQAATTTFTVQRQARGARRGRKCVKPSRKTRRARRCKRYLAVRGSFTHADAAGTNSLRFTGWMSRRRLRPGTYRLTARPQSAAGRGAPRATTFRVRR